MIKIVCNQKRRTSNQKFYLPDRTSLPRVSLARMEILLAPGNRATVNVCPCGERQFSFAAPYLWNSLPVRIRQAKSVQCFKKQLKTYFYKLAYD